MVAIDEQSADIARGVDESCEAQHGDTDPLDHLGAGDQDDVRLRDRETEELMPLPILLAHTSSEASRRGPQGGRPAACGRTGSRR